MPILSRQQILEADDIRIEEVNVPEWGGSVCVRTFSAADRARFELGTDEVRDVRERLAAATICDEAGNLIFTAEDVEALGKKSGAALDRVFARARKLNRLSNKDLEEIQGNSSPIRNENSPTS
jgi:hypothetical protein